MKCLDEIVTDCTHYCATVIMFVYYYVNYILIHFRTSLRQVPFYFSQMRYELRSFCCDGYLGNADSEAFPRCIRMLMI